MTRIIITSLIIFFSTFIGFGQDSTKKDNLTVYGENFCFSVKEPVGWIGDIESATEYYSNIVFYKNKKDLENGGAIVQVLAFTKQDEKTNEDLNYDIGKYKKEYENLKQQDLPVDHSEYKCYSKLVFVENSFYQYIVYINPGKEYKNGLSISMNISKREASEAELKAFLLIINSVWMIK